MIIIPLIMCGLITYVMMKASELEDFYKIKRKWRILIRLTYIAFWPIYFMRMFCLILTAGIKFFTKTLLE